MFVVFRRPICAPQPVELRRTGRRLASSDDPAPGPWAPARLLSEYGAHWLEATEGGALEIVWSDGHSTVVTVPPPPEPGELKAPWTVEFVDGRGAPPLIRMKTLMEWMTSQDDAIRHYSGAG